MKIVKTIIELDSLLAPFREEHQTIGFVPTMGALHDGHLALVKQSVAENKCCVVSIFVNPTQFNDKNDLSNYPRMLEVDCQKLEDAGCSIVFAPDEREMYPEEDKRVFNFGVLEQVMEGAHRPGHFNGVAQIVSKLFEIVRPNKAYFGEKDFQQLAIIRAMVKQLELNVEIIACPIIREEDGLAMSSRNLRLTPSQRQVAAMISKTLVESKKRALNMSVKELQQWVVSTIDKGEELHTEYFELVDGKTLQSIANWTDTNYVVGCIAVFCGKIRLIDNIRYQ